MKKFLAIVPLMALATLMWLPVHADDNGALVISDSGCNIPFAVSAKLDSHGVVTSNGQGVLTCRTDVPPPASGHAEQYDHESFSHYLCRLSSGISKPARFPDSTTDWKLTISASGKAVLTCHFDDLNI